VFPGGVLFVFILAGICVASLIWGLEPSLVIVSALLHLPCFLSPLVLGFQMHVCCTVSHVSLIWPPPGHHESPSNRLVFSRMSSCSAGLSFSLTPLLEFWLLYLDLTHQRSPFI
jgi:hypothetical protein